MPRINLLPVRAARQRDTIKNELYMISGVLLLVLVGTYAWYSTDESEISELGARVEALDGEIRELERDVVKVEGFKGKEQTISKKLQVINQLMAAKVGPAKMLDELATVLTQDAKRVWLTRLTEAGGNLKLEGAAVDGEDVSEFQIALERARFFANVRLVKLSSSKDTTGTTIFTWEIVGVVNYGAG